MSSDLETIWYVAATVDCRVTTNPNNPVTYYLVTYRPDNSTIEIRFVYEHVGRRDPSGADLQRIAREHWKAFP